MQKQFRRQGHWALASDGAQWILQHRGGNAWHAVSFVTSTKKMLARCMRKRRVPHGTLVKLLAGLPDTFMSWRATA